MNWNRHDIVTASLAAGRPGIAFDPMRVQKLMFLVDREVSERIGGPYFEFRPYLYGPFDPAVYRALESLEGDGHLWTDHSGRYPCYLLTDPGARRGMALLEGSPEAVASYIQRAARWVQLMPYRRMLMAIYQRYPDTAVNSVVRPATVRRRQRRSPFLRGMARAFDFSGARLRLPDSGRTARSDSAAIRDVWREVGEGLEEAMIEFGESEHLW